MSVQCGAFVHVCARATARITACEMDSVTPRRFPPAKELMRGLILAPKRGRGGQRSLSSGCVRLKRRLEDWQKEEIRLGGLFLRRRLGRENKRTEELSGKQEVSL